LTTCRTTGKPLASVDPAQVPADALQLLTFQTALTDDDPCTGAFDPPGHRAHTAKS